MAGALAGGDPTLALPARRPWRIRHILLAAAVIGFLLWCADGVDLRPNAVVQAVPLIGTYFAAIEHAFEAALPVRHRGDLVDEQAPHRRVSAIRRGEPQDLRRQVIGVPHVVPIEEERRARSMLAHRVPHAGLQPG
jgi:hypothetical protein